MQTPRTYAQFLKVIHFGMYLRFKLLLKVLYHRIYAHGMDESMKGMDDSLVTTCQKRHNQTAAVFANNGRDLQIFVFYLFQRRIVNMPMIPPRPASARVPGSGTGCVESSI
jgi:hypothetical protein